jgi:hypothetical protein
VIVIYGETLPNWVWGIYSLNTLSVAPISKEDEGNFHYCDFLQNHPRSKSVEPLPRPVGINELEHILNMLHKKVLFVQFMLHLATCLF